MAAAATDALPEPPIAAIPCRRPSASRRPAIAPAPRPITSIARPRSAAPTRPACSAPPPAAARAPGAGVLGAAGGAPRLAWLGAAPRRGAHHAGADGGVPGPRLLD